MIDNLESADQPGDAVPELPKPPAIDRTAIETRPIVMMDGRPGVSITLYSVDDPTHRLTCTVMPQDARRVSAGLMEAAATAEYDALLVRYVILSTGGDLAAAQQLVGGFQGMRLNIEAARRAGIMREMEAAAESIEGHKQGKGKGK